MKIESAHSDIKEVKFSMDEDRTSLSDRFDAPSIAAGRPSSSPLIFLFIFHCPPLLFLLSSSSSSFLPYFLLLFTRRCLKQPSSKVFETPVFSL